MVLPWKIRVKGALRASALGPEPAVKRLRVVGPGLPGHGAAGVVLAYQAEQVFGGVGGEQRAVIPALGLVTGRAAC